MLDSNAANGVDVLVPVWVKMTVNEMMCQSFVIQHRNNILYLVESYQTVIIVGETGCGKTTQIPQVIMIKLRLGTIKFEQFSSVMSVFTDAVDVVATQHNTAAVDW